MSFTNSFVQRFLAVEKLSFGGWFLHSFMPELWSSISVTIWIKLVLFFFPSICMVYILVLGNKIALKVMPWEVLSAKEARRSLKNIGGSAEHFVQCSIRLIQRALVLFSKYGGGVAQEMHKKCKKRVRCSSKRLGKCYSIFQCSSKPSERVLALF